MCLGPGFPASAAGDRLGRRRLHRRPNPSRMYRQECCRGRELAGRRPGAVAMRRL